jgi:hypothetical protein
MTFLSLLLFQRVVIVQEAYCHGRPPHGVDLQGMELCRFGLGTLSHAEYIELDTMQTESLHKPWLTLDDFDHWRKTNYSVPPTKIPTTPPSPEVSSEKGDRGAARRTSTESPAIVTTTSVPLSTHRIPTTITTTTKYLPARSGSSTGEDASSSSEISDIFTSSTTVRLGPGRAGTILSEYQFLYTIFHAKILLKFQFQTKISNFKSDVKSGG